MVAILRMNPESCNRQSRQFSHLFSISVAADAAEVFYCAPVMLKEHHPEVYDLLAGYFRVNPLAWFPEN